MFDPKKFWTKVVTTNVVKGYDYVILPDGRRIPVPSGKYMKITNVAGKAVFAFEDMTGEIGEKPDWDFEEPYCVVESISGAVVKSVRLKCKYTALYENHLYYGRVKVCEFKPGNYEVNVTFSYVDRDEALIASVGAGALAGGVGYVTTKDVGTGLILGGGVGGTGALLSFLLGE